MATEYQKTIVRQEIKSHRVPCPLLRDNGSMVHGHLSVAECEFPHAVFDSLTQHIDIEIPWELAYRLITGSALYVRI